MTLMHMVAPFYLCVYVCERECMCVCVCVCACALRVALPNNKVLAKHAHGGMGVGL